MSGFYGNVGERKEYGSYHVLRVKGLGLRGSLPQ